jgi:hypothetical protein
MTPPKTQESCVKDHDIPLEMAQPTRDAVQGIEIQHLVFGGTPIQHVQMPPDGNPEILRPRMPV